ncbi:unnamed protein product [Adineta ricciae]|uniref:Transmembrane protein n=1 Tax=Adineta ricciae TaxID=249248 RepID=A0A815LXE0_ADIRI|nr:unnamed protein product [Adineta ricciae]CAF1410024.1 unnamed protein product [Adineta ricciae]
MEHYETIRRYFIDLNLFDSKTNDAHVKRNEILSTRIYIVLLLTIVVLFTLYMCLISQTNTITIAKPTQEQFERLTNKYENKLQCLCKQISIPYRQFMNIQPVFDEICLSDFVSQKWIDYLFYENTSYYFQLDFRHSAASKFQILRALCEQARLTIGDNLEKFYVNQFLSNQLITQTIFDAQTSSFIDSFQMTTFSIFQTLLKFIRNLVISNALFSGAEMLSTLQFDNNSYPYVGMENSRYYQERVQGKFFGCYCENFTICQLQEGIYTQMNMFDYAGSDWSGYKDINASTNMINATFLVRGMFSSCKHMESLMQSTSECLSDQLCLNQIGSYINHSSVSISSFPKLNSSNPARYLTIETLANNLFVGNWILNKSYSAYFASCQPSTCQYTDAQKYSFIYILTSVITLYGGVRGLLAYFIPIIITHLRKKKIQSPPSTAVPPHPQSTMTWVSSVFQHISQLNIFNSYSSDEHEQKNEIISSKIYLIALGACLLGFAIALSQGNQSRTVYIYNPTRFQFEQLNNRSTINLQCPCAKITIKYSKFLHFNPTYHQICNSIFVSNLWYNSYDIWDVSIPCVTPSFSDLASFYFSFLSTLCQSAHDIIYSGLAQIDSMNYVTSEAILENQFNNEMEAFIKLFEQRLQTSFRGQLALMQGVIFTNQIISSKATNVYYNHTKLINNTITVDSYLTTHENCTCGTNPKCYTDLAVCSSNRMNYIKGMYVGCFVVDSVLISTTECFFDETCIELMKSSMKNSSELYQQMYTLNSSAVSEYQINDLIGTLVGNLFIEQWNEVYSYNAYYNECQPIYCSYTVQQTSSVIYILTRLIGLYGGLTFLLGYLVPNIVTVIRRKRHQRAGVSIWNRFGIYYQTTKTKLIELNWFESNTNDEENLRKEIITTRVYLIVFTLVLLTLVFYSSLIDKTINVKVSLSSLSQYQQVQMKYPNTFNCPCNEISVPYKDFLVVSPIYHEVCSSDFIQQSWIEYLYNEQTITDQNYRAVAAAQFQVLSYLCIIADGTIQESLAQFYSTKFITNDFIPFSLFQIQTDSIVDIFQKTLSQTFNRPFEMTQDLLQGNSLMSVFQTNWKFTVLKTSSWSPIYTNPMFYNQICNCGTSSKCTQPVFINNTLVDGLYIGCYPVETMLQSSLQCFYNQTCLQMILSYFGELPKNMTLRVLSVSSQYGIDETIQEMVDRLFVNQWIINQSYENYFLKCQPTYCTYSYTEYFNIFYTITTILGLFDGVTVLLRLIVPLVIYFIFRIFYKTKISNCPLTQ